MTERRLSIASAAAEVADEFGIGSVTVTVLCQVARCRRRAFYELFSSREDCIRFTAARGFEQLFTGVRSAAGEEGPWKRRVEKGVGALFAAAFADPASARFVLIHTRALPIDAERLDAEAAVVALAGLLASRPGAEGPVGPREDYVARVYLSLLAGRLSGGEVGAIPGLGEKFGGWPLALLGRPRASRPAGSRR
jgi:AcrR family transcriptional regulator